MIDYASKRFHEEVATWPDGTYEADCWVDHDPRGVPDVHLHVAVTVDGDHLKVDFDGTDTRQELQSWSTFGNTRGYTVAQIAAMDPEIPTTRGSSRPSSCRCPRGACSTPGPASR